MTNPFERRATEYLRDDVAFLSVITPEPITTYLERSARDRRLYDQLTLIIGNPGSGKTTLARLFEFRTLSTLIRNRSLATYRPLMDTLTASGALVDGRPNVVACRLPLESEYREFWEFPYPEELKLSLMMALVQARAVLAWFRNFEAAGIFPEQVQIVARADSAASVEAAGGLTGDGMLLRAREMERAIYRISAALVPPAVEQISQVATSAYRPFDVIEAFRYSVGEEVAQNAALVIFDDAHSLHPAQFSGLTRWLARRELKISRWVITRMDLLAPEQVFGDDSNDRPGFTAARDTNEIRMQGASRGSGRAAFRKMAKDMAGRYLRQTETFQRQGLNDLGDLLATEPKNLTSNQIADIRKSAEDLAQNLRIGPTAFAELQTSVDDYLLASKGDDGEDVRAKSLVILLNRYSKRNLPPSLFEEINETDPDHSRVPKMGPGVVEAARVQLSHEWDRPLYFGIDDVARASSENAELFLRLCGRLVDQSETQLIRGRPAMLSAKAQTTALRQRAIEVVNDWDFPYAASVRQLAGGIADQCVRKSLEANAPLDGGATAFGIPQSEFDRLPHDHPDLARILKFGFAYNAFEIRTNHSTKNRTWCLIQLGGPVLLKHGLTLQQGGFLERGVPDLSNMLKQTESS